LSIATPVFDGAREESDRGMLEAADLPLSGQTILFDGRSVNLRPERDRRDDLHAEAASSRGQNKITRASIGLTPW